MASHTIDEILHATTPQLEAWLKEAADPIQRDLIEGALGERLR
jgi:hypothetical protein